MTLESDNNTTCNSLTVNRDVTETFDTSFIVGTIADVGEDPEYVGVLAYNASNGLMYFSVDDGGGPPFTWQQLEAV
jgi:hypothetical protein